MLGWRLNGILVAAFLTTSATASVDLPMGYDFSAADGLYQKRADGNAAIDAAVTAYEGALGTELSFVELTYAVEQIARLYTYKSNFLPNSGEIVAAGDSCLAAVEKLNPQNVPATPQYYYWHATCRLFWARARGPIQSLTYAKTVDQIITEGGNLDPTYEGGGFSRLAGILYSHLPRPNPFGAPHGDLDRALAEFRNSLDSASAYEHPLGATYVDPETETGEYFYTTHYFYALALKKSGQVDQAKAFATKTIRDIEGTDGGPAKLPKGREPETKIAITLLQQLLAE